MEKVASGKFLAMEPVPNYVRANPTPATNKKEQSKGCSFFIAVVGLNFMTFHSMSLLSQEGDKILTKKNAKGDRYPLAVRLAIAKITRRS